MVTFRQEDDTHKTGDTVVVGSPENFWIWSHDSGWDLTHPESPEAAPVRTRLLLECDISNIAIDPSKTALLIIDMQNYSLDDRLQTALPGLDTTQIEETLLKQAIPATRATGIQVIWLNWGLTEKDLSELPPSALRVFNWRANARDVDYGLSSRAQSSGINSTFLKCGEFQRSTSLGADLGSVKQGDGWEIEAGRALMRDTWNTALHHPLALAFEHSQQSTKPDVIIYKNRNSGLFEPWSDCNQYLRQHGIRTLLFAGMNTDQCVMGTLQDAHSGGYDTILLRDGCCTDSPQYAQLSAEYNCCRNWGFVTTCSALASAAAKLQPS